VGCAAPFTAIVVLVADEMLATGFVAKHLDQTMRKGQGSMSAEAFEKVLDDIVDLVKFTKDKDVFKEFYITQLAKRLLLARSASTEEEINMVKKLQSGKCCWCDVLLGYVADCEGTLDRIWRGVHDR
jgi:hypothetical protein